MISPLPFREFSSLCSDGRIGIGAIEQIEEEPGAWPGPELAETNGLFLLLVRLFVSGLRTARALILLRRAGRILVLLLRVARCRRLRVFVGTLLRICHSITFQEKDFQYVPPLV
jgi:hypothetical protein